MDKGDVRETQKKEEAIRKEYKSAKTTEETQDI
jgi:hypothetical protein